MVRAAAGREYLELWSCCDVVFESNWITSSPQMNVCYKHEGTLPIGGEGPGEACLGHQMC